MAGQTFFLTADYVGRGDRLAVHHLFVARIATVSPLNHCLTFFTQEDLFFQDPLMPATYWGSESVLTRHLRIGMSMWNGLSLDRYTPTQPHKQIHL